MRFVLYWFVLLSQLTFFVWPFVPVIKDNLIIIWQRIQYYVWLSIQINDRRGRFSDQYSWNSGQKSSRLMHCPSMGPNWFLSVQIILDRSKLWNLIWTFKTLWTRPKDLDPTKTISTVQNHFWPIDGQGISHRLTRKNGKRLHRAVEKPCFTTYCDKQNSAWQYRL